MRSIASIACSEVLSTTLRARFDTIPNEVSFVDEPAIATLDPAELDSPSSVIAVCDARATAIRALMAHPWLCHVVSGSMLESSMAAGLIDNVAATTGRARPLLDWVRNDLVGRRSRLTRASQRADRLGRMASCFAASAVDPTTQRLLVTATEELLHNAFYEAPVAAGVAEPIESTVDVGFPDDSACDVVYGCTETLALVRVRDPFGALSRGHIVESPSLMWICSMASLVAISVVKDHHTDIMIGIARHGDPEPSAFAFHMFFKDSVHRRSWRLRGDDPAATSSGGP